MRDIKKAIEFYDAMMEKDRKMDFTAAELLGLMDKTRTEDQGGAGLQRGRK